MRKFQCRYCSHIYEEAIGDADTGLPPGTLWDDIPDSWMCPDCGATKDDYDEIL
ncbi:rubredoxin [uncultured Zhongshania sp.]|uniref:rubredoxin n=1 Tax=uncultured Zhongshania sp. TaxID=1642288 RepID=UPI0030DA4119